MHLEIACDADFPARLAVVAFVDNGLVYRCRTVPYAEASSIATSYAAIGIPTTDHRVSVHRPEDQQ